ncbi:unnamed protein product, partial [marine sediment metagenome]
FTPSNFLIKYLSKEIDTDNNSQYTDADEQSVEL